MPQPVSLDVVPALRQQDRVVAAAALEAALPALSQELDPLARLAAAVMGTQAGMVVAISPGRQVWAGSNDERRDRVAGVPDRLVTCAHVVAGRAPLVVRDCAADGRFAEHPAVAAGAVGFYAGVPLVDPNGLVLGSVCVTDPRPRGRDEPVPLAGLLDLARQASSLLALHQQRAEQAAQRDALAAVAAGRPLAETLDRLTRDVERLLGPDLLCSVLVVDAEDRGVLRSGSGPSLPAPFLTALDGLRVGEGVGACGTAVHRGEPVVVSDLATDPLCVDFREITSRHGLAACASTPVLGADGTRLGAFALYRRTPGVPTAREWQVITGFADITRVAIERDRAQRELSRLATRDDVTGLLNRAAFLRAATDLLGGPAGTRRHSVLFCDVDRFKMVNDSLGHAGGDAYLRAVAAALRAELRPGDLLARFAGDVFVVAVPGIDGDTARALATRVGACFAAPVDVDGHQLRLSASIGLATTELTGSHDLPTLLRDADLAMRGAKAAGGAQVRVCDAPLQRQATDRLALALALRDAVGGPEMSVHYQPEFDATTEELVGVEALLRWHRSGHGPVSPADFIPVAEDTGLIGALGRHVLATACRDLAEWRDRYPGARRITAWVNVSPQQLADPRLVPTVADALTRNGLPGAALGLEITETAVMTDPDVARATLHALRGLGVRVAIDDFGTGYSSLATLKTLPVDFIKIDRAFVRDLGEGSADSRLITAIISMSHSLGLAVVAEGVETDVQHAELRAQGCDVVQGFLLGRPAPADQLAPVLSWGRRPPVQAVDAARRSHRSGTPAAEREGAR